MGKSRGARKQRRQNKKETQNGQCTTGILPNRKRAGEAGFDSHAEDVARYLRDTGILHDNATLLDIGSGTGAYSLSFAKRCAKVTALDMEDMSLSVLTDHASMLGLSNINCIRGMWETYEPDRKFSVTFSSMCPAICTHEELLKMEAMTGETCCLIAVTRGSYDLHRKNLMAAYVRQAQGRHDDRSALVL